MDETIEIPSTSLLSKENVAGDGKVDSSDDEEVLDWSKLAPRSSRERKVIPKKGEKAFEPITMGPSAYQKFTLDKARKAMIDALSASRDIQTKRLSQAIWMPRYSRAQVIDSRGTTFIGLGYTIRRPEYTEKRLELLPEEVLYMVERGSMFCWRQSEKLHATPDDEQGDPIKVVGEPMSVQQCFSSMLGVEGIALEHYQVYAYLKRFGYTVRRAHSFEGLPEYVVYQHSPIHFTVISWLKQYLSRMVGILNHTLEGNWWHRFRPGFMSSFSGTHFPSKFKSLRIIPTQPSNLSSPKPSLSPYEIFYHVWKPDTPWNRTQLPRPDFEVVVVNARTTPVPSIQDFTSLFANLPSTSIGSPSNPTQPDQANRSLMGRFITWLRTLFQRTRQTRINPFAVLKAGKTSVILAVMDAGTMTMYRFNEGCFAEWPMI